MKHRAYGPVMSPVERWTQNYAVTGRRWIESDHGQADLPLVGPMRLSYFDEGVPDTSGTRISIEADDHRTGVGLDLGQVPPGLVTALWVTTPVGEAGNSTWGLHLEEPVRWLPHGSAHQVCTATSGAHQYRVTSDVAGGRWTLTAQPIGAEATWLTDLNLSLLADPAWPPWKTLAVRLRHTSSTGGINWDLELTARS